MKFSERYGYTKVKEVIQFETMTDKLRNKLWNIVHFMLFKYTVTSLRSKAFSFEQAKESFFKFYWEELEGQAFDKMPGRIDQALRNYFYRIEWYDVYNFLEYYLDVFKNEYEINITLEDELAGYRFVNGLCTPITDQKEIDALQEALDDKDYPGVRIHLTTALKLLSNRENPDYRNSIKESISSVESLAQTITGNPKATLGDALKVLEKKHNLHSALKRSFESLYGYTSDGDGIRHSLMEDPNLNVNDAKFFLLSCTSFINYLKTKI